MPRDSHTSALTYKSICCFKVEKNRVTRIYLGQSQNKCIYIFFDSEKEVFVLSSLAFSEHRSVSLNDAENVRARMI